MINAFNSSRQELHNAKNNETEYRESGGVLMIPRAITDASFDREMELNSAQVRPVRAPLRQGDRALQMDLKVPGSVDSLRWATDEEAFLPMADEDIEIHTTYASLNAIDLKTITSINASSGQIGREAVGVISRVGSKVTNLVPGETVVVLKSHAFKTHLRQH